MPRKTLFAVVAAALLALVPRAEAQTPNVDYFVGSWGVVSYNDETDLQRMIGVARSYCNIPYRIARRSAETFEMFVAENLREVRLMQQTNGVFIVPVQAEGGVLRGARELRIRSNDVFTLRYLENSNHQRYGLNVFVRCGGARR